MGNTLAYFNYKSLCHTQAYLISMISKINGNYQTHSSDWITYLVTYLEFLLNWENLLLATVHSELEFTTGVSKTQLAGVTQSF